MTGSRTISEGTAVLIFYGLPALSLPLLAVFLPLTGVPAIRRLLARHRILLALLPPPLLPFFAGLAYWLSRAPDLRIVGFIALPYLSGVVMFAMVTAMGEGDG